MRVQLSFEERIINALDHLGGQKRSESVIAYDVRRFEAIRAIMQPLYDELTELRSAPTEDSDGE